MKIRIRVGGVQYFTMYKYGSGLGPVRDPDPGPLSRAAIDTTTQRFDPDNYPYMINL